MSISFAQLKAEAAKLSDAERPELALEMLRSLDPADDADPDEIEQAGLREIKRRSAEIGRGEARVIPVDGAFARNRQRFG